MIHCCPKGCVTSRIYPVHVPQDNTSACSSYPEPFTVQPYPKYTDKCQQITHRMPYNVDNISQNEYLVLGTDIGISKARRKLSLKRCGYIPINKRPQKPRRLPDLKVYALQFSFVEPGPVFVIHRKRNHTKSSNATIHFINFILSAAS